MYTVAELIKTLQQCPQDYEVVMNIFSVTNYVTDEYSIETAESNHDTKTVDLFSE